MLQTSSPKPLTKFCRWCQTEKPVTEFYVRYVYNNPPSTYCKECTKQRAMASEKRVAMGMN
jgi:hypothetical protein